MKRLVAATTIAIALLAATEAAASSLTFEVTTLMNGTHAPTSGAPWLTATFDSEGQAAGTVLLTVTSGLEVPSEFITALAFNVDPRFMPSGLIITQKEGPMATEIVQAGQDAQRLIGGGSAGSGFDVLMRFVTAGGPGPGSRRLDNADIAVFSISASGLTVDDFNFTNSGSSASWFAAHVQGIPLVGEGMASSAVDGGPVPPLGPDGPIDPTGQVVPEPASMLLLGTGLAGLLARRRLRS